MKPSTIIRLLDLQYMYQYKPETYAYYTQILKERLEQGENVEVVQESDSKSIFSEPVEFVEFLRVSVEGK